MHEDPNVASVGIRGGDTESVKAYLRQKGARHLCLLTKVVLYIGGNNLAQRRDGTQIPKQTAQEVSLAIEGLVRFILAFIPNADVTTMDLLPRSTNGFFNCRARCIARGLVQQDTNRHHHALILKGFLIKSRVKTAENFVPKDLFYRNSDGVHLNTLGYSALEQVNKWLFESVRRLGDTTRVIVHEHEIGVNMKF